MLIIANHTERARDLGSHFSQSFMIFHLDCQCTRNQTTRSFCRQANLSGPRTLRPPVWRRYKRPLLFANWWVFLLSATR